MMGENNGIDPRRIPKREVEFPFSLAIYLKVNLGKIT